jgi:hypothetical protein
MSTNQKLEVPNPSFGFDQEIKEYFLGHRKKSKKLSFMTKQTRFFILKIY